MESKEFLEDFEGVRQAAKDSLRRAQITFQRSYDENHIPLSLEPGDQVMINVHSLKLPDVIKGKGSKLTRRFEGPFEVTDKISEVAYRIRIPHTYDIHPVISIAHLEKFTPSPEEFGERPALKKLQEDQKTTQEFEVIKIVDERRCKRGEKFIKEYKCDWKGYGITEEWIPLSNLRNAQELLQEWDSIKKEKLLQKESDLQSITKM